MSGFTQSATGRVMAAEMRRALRRRRLTQAMLARQVGLHLAMLNRVLNQRDTVGRLATWDAMARAVGARWEVRLVFDDEEEG